MVAFQEHCMRPEQIEIHRKMAMKFDRALIASPPAPGGGKLSAGVGFMVSTSLMPVACQPRCRALQAFQSEGRFVMAMCSVGGDSRP
eukprot:11369723-Alexandrium_andersonii.AAC.1